MRRAVLAVTGLAVGTPLLVALKLGPAGPQASAADAASAARTGAADKAGAADPGGEEGATPASQEPRKPAKPATGRRTVVGTAQDTPYGAVKVQIVLNGAKITDVQAVDLPQTEPRSISLNERAIPQLRKEVLAKQGADVDTVSGATFTSEGYLNSLQAALDSAGVGG